MIHTKYLYAIGFVCLSNYLYAMELNEKEIQKRYNQEIKSVEQKIKENLEKERDITQQALDKIKKREDQLNRVIHTILNGQTEEKYLEQFGKLEVLDQLNRNKELLQKEIRSTSALSPATIYKKRKIANLDNQIRILDKEIAETNIKRSDAHEFSSLIYTKEVLGDDKFFTINNLETINKKLRNIPGYIKSLQHTLLRIGEPDVNRTEDYQLQIKDYGKIITEPLLPDDKIKAYSRHHNRISFPLINKDFDNMIIHELAKVNAKSLKIPKENLRDYRTQLADIIGIPTGWKTPLYSAKEPTLWQRLSNWLYSKPSATMGLTRSTQRQPVIPTSYRDYIRQIPSSAWKQTKQGLEKKAESYYKWKQQEKEAGLLPPPGWD